MIITNDFVLINFPKTGSTFARQIISDIYLKKVDKNRTQRILSFLKIKKKYFYKELYLPKTEYLLSNGDVDDQHGRYVQVPAEHRSKPVLSIVRDPIIRNISFYEFAWWKKSFNAGLEEIMQSFPSFPDLDFVTYLRFQKFNSKYRDTGVGISEDIGEQTVQFIQYIFKNPKDVFKKLNDEYIYSGAYKSDLPELTLLSTENLNEELCRYLANFGFRKNELEFIKSRQPVRPEGTIRKSAEDRLEYLSHDLIKSIRHNERYLYRIYSDHGFAY